jgi:hypothetical protein
MIAYDTIDFNGGKFFRDVIYPVYYFVLGSFDNERNKLDGRSIACKNKQISISIFVYFFL